jgi:hypothetical protein
MWLFYVGHKCRLPSLVIRHGWVRPESDLFQLIWSSWCKNGWASDRVVEPVRLVLKWSNVYSLRPTNNCMFTIQKFSQNKRTHSRLSHPRSRLSSRRWDKKIKKSLVSSKKKEKINRGCLDVDSRGSRCFSSTRSRQ